MKKKILALALSALMALSLAACGGSSSSAPAAPAASAADSAAASAPAEAAKYTVGICQLVQHDALDAATQGFMDAINEALPGQVEFDEQNASGDIPTCATICNGFAASNVDLIMANATPALQAAVSATENIPILGTSVTEYGVALDIDNFNGTVGGNVSGTSDLAPLDQQADMLMELLPDAQTIGILYCSAEANSVYQANVVEECLTAAGKTVNVYTFADSNDVSSVTATACAENDALYIPTDNTAASCTEAINNVAEPAGVPIITGEEGICKGCGIATLSISYYELGRTTGEMAVKILTGESNISEMPIEYYPNPVKKYNADLADALGVTIPAGYEAIA
ncbi:ABC transporter substrate-binding protein [Dysosmobacter sp.]|uniref:ABC transporter substrate-binding protein n=1 Tax=Dysosmobacter sp. TaxID=2591382 RepID=UPI002A8D3F69|nr:ABC transporter substrate-binding protein [Dysosmobacter sp.]MDY3282081.1 ABC transporter substrate-binding protein [Dysosmobacter sp.]